MQKLPSRYLTQDFAIFMKVRAYNDERQAFKDYYIEEGVIPRDLEGDRRDYAGQETETNVGWNSGI